jgi:hypothetical protein
MGRLKQKMRQGQKQQNRFAVFALVAFFASLKPFLKASGERLP